MGTSYHRYNEKIWLSCRAFILGEKGTNKKRALVVARSRRDTGRRFKCVTVYPHCLDSSHGGASSFRSESERSEESPAGRGDLPARRGLRYIRGLCVSPEPGKRALDCQRMPAGVSKHSKRNAKTFLTIQSLLQKTICQKLRSSSSGDRSANP